MGEDDGMEEYGNQMDQQDMIDYGDEEEGVYNNIRFVELEGPKPSFKFRWEDARVDSKDEEESSIKRLKKYLFLSFLYYVKLSKYIQSALKPVHTETKPHFQGLRIDIVKEE